MQHQMIRGSAIVRAFVTGMAVSGTARCGRILLTCGLICGAAACPLFGQEQRRDDKRVSIQPTPQLANRKQVLRQQQPDEGKTSDVLEMRIPKFRVRNAPLTYVVQMINALGVQVCYEGVIGEQPWQGYVDQQGVIAFHADRLYSLDLAGVSVAELLDEIVKADSRYTWTRVMGTNVLNLVPRRGSQLDFEVGPVDEVDNPLNIIMKLGRKPAWRLLSPSIVRGGRHPEMTVNVDRCSARQLLNQMARQRAGLSWHCSPGAPLPGTTFVYVPDPLVQQVMLVYPKLAPGKTTNLKFRYDIKWDHVADGVATVIVEKTSIAGE